MAFSMGMSWNEGEEKMHKLLRVPDQDNPTSAMLTPQASFMFQRAPLLAIGTLDDESRPWTALWGGAPGFSEPIGGGFVGTRTLVDSKYDPVVQALVGSASKGEMLQPKDGGKMLSGLAIDLVTRKRVKFAGKMAAGTVKEVKVELEEGTELPKDAPKTQDQIQLVTKIEESLGNCPKYLNQYELRPALVTSELISEGPNLSSAARDLIDSADMFFLSTATATDMDTNHRGGPPGFVRIVSPTCIIYPEYSGNRLYQSLGNLQLNPLVGITFPDYETGNVLYTTGTAEILVGADAARTIPGTNLAVKINLTSTRLIAHGLAFRGTRKLNGASPYTPLVRPLATEGALKSHLTPNPSSTSATLISKHLLTPSIAHFTFRAPTTQSWTPGQWIALSFAAELDTGYEHMRDDDPRSLNDDFVRTFTISSPPPSNHDAKGPTEFTITIRRVGPATHFLFNVNPRAGLELPILGIGGSFGIAQSENQVTPFIAGGVGITPLLADLPHLDLDPARLLLLWAVRGADVPLVKDTLERYPGLARCTRVFVTGGEEGLEGLGLRVEGRRMEEGDFEGIDAKRWYLCAGKAFREQVVKWLPGREVVFEDFDF